MLFILCNNKARDFEADELIRRLVRNLRRTADQATPDFLQKMPDAYFRETDDSTLLVHLSAVVAARASGVPPRMILKDPERQTWTFVHEQSYRGLLSDLVAQLPREQALTSAKVHTATDGGLVLDVFRFGEESRFDPEAPGQGNKLAAVKAYALGLGDDAAQEELPRYLAQCSADFVMSASPLRVYETWQLTRQVERTEDVACALAAQSDPKLVRISVVAGNADTRVLFERFVGHLGRLGLDITRAFVDVIHSDDGQKVASVGFVVREPSGRLIAPDGQAWKELRHDFRRLRWVDDSVIDRVKAHPDLGLTRAEVLVALTRHVHGHLARDNPFAFTRDRLLSHLDHCPGLATAVADLFLSRFDAEGRRRSDAPMVASLRSRIDDEVDTEMAQRFWRVLVTAADSVLRCNAHRPDRYGLAMMLDPSFLVLPLGAESPFGVFFVHADSTDAYHVRFEDLARGGVRAVCPRGAEQYALASERLFDEAYDLAYAQQLKNKDIPEGGAKAVVLVEPKGGIEPGVKAFVDGLLDLLVDPDDRLYFGPDENISPSLIDWIVRRAETRGYPLPWALMSSKPGAGINHKEYGVTSEGVTVFLEEALRAVGIDPRRDHFTIKLTGGPDGDVAGNQIRILHREFGNRARIVGIADGSGAGWDPDGLDHDELLRLVSAEEPIACFDRGRLGPNGAIVYLDQPDGLRRRNRLHFEVVADAFIPAGGRPQTINGDNWAEYLRDGVPSSKVIVEGANLFITPEARRQLAGSGVIIVKDSTANKCGVICSSYEIVASMLLSPEELMNLKPRFVPEVLEKLRQLARSEAVRLFRDYTADPSIALPDRAVALSRAILRATGAVAGALASIDESQRGSLMQVARDHLPPSLVEVAGPELKRLPRAYCDRTIAAGLAARIVYREGLDFVDRVSDEALGPRCLSYFFEEEEAAGLARQVLQSRLPQAERIAQLLRSGGARTALMLRSLEQDD